MKLLSVLVLAILVSACGAPSASHPQEKIVVSNAWARPTPGGVDIAAGYLTIVNRSGADDTLLSATSTRGQVEIHTTMMMGGGMMSMRHAEGLPIKAGATLTLTPGGAHLMFEDLPAPFAVGDQIPVTLSFAHAGSIETTLSVQQNPPS
ncbi:MAG: copper chaperone PCu(A)C [Pseudomonadota bacterium]